MATTNIYNKTNWVNDGVPAINEANLNKIEVGIADATNAIRVLEDRPIPVPDVPVGSVIMFAGNSIPTDYAVCDGGLLNRTTSVALFNVIGTIYGVGDGTTTFNKPDLRGLFVRGLDDGAGIDGEPDRVLGSIQDDEVGPHDHELKNVTLKVTPYDFDYNAGSEGKRTNTGTTELNDGLETRPKNIAMYYIIRVV